MARLEVADGAVIVRVGFVGAMLSMRSTMRFPLSSVVRAFADPVVKDEPRGIKAPGTYIPRVLSMGTFHAQGVKSYWNVRTGESVVVVELTGEKFDRLVIEHADAEAVAERIIAARDSND